MEKKVGPGGIIREEAKKWADEFALRRLAKPMRDKILKERRSLTCSRNTH